MQRVHLTAITKPIDNISIEEFLVRTCRVSSTRINKTESYDQLIKYLLIHKHWSPFEMVNIVFEIYTTRAIGRQIIRHRSMAFQELSQRYAQAENILIPEMRLENQINRQSSIPGSDTFKAEMNEIVTKSCADSYKAYQTLIQNGVAKETARMVLPECTETIIHCNGTIRSWLHFLDQRLDPNAQFELQQIAQDIQNKLTEKIPIIMNVYRSLKNNL